MKQFFIKPLVQFAVLVTLVCSQFVFAGDHLIGRDDGQNTKPSTIMSNRQSVESSFYMDDIATDIVWGGVK